MNKEQALNTFWNTFSIPAYDVYTVPDDVAMPYITYEASTASIGTDVLLSASFWYKGMSWGQITAKKDEISSYIGGGASQPYDGGRVWIRKATPFSQRMSEPDDPNVRRIVIQIMAEFQSAD